MMNSPRKSPRKRKIDKPECGLIPTRSKQVDILLSLMGKQNQMTLPCLFVYGHTATGKTYTIERIVSEMNLPHAWINCIEAYNPRLIMESTLNKLAKVEPGPENNYTGYANCVNMCDFIRLLKKVVEEKKWDEQTVYLVFDNAERLRDLPPLILAAILRLQELSRLNLCVILISELVWEKFQSGVSFYQPFVVHFPDYTKDETISLMLQDRDPDIPLPIYTDYVKLVLNFFAMATRNIQELRYVALSNFQHYYGPILNEEIAAKSTHKLFQNVVPYLTKALQSVYLREAESLSIQNNKPITEISIDNRANVELPLYSKQLLIAAYIASYNPPNSDKKFFLKNTGKAYKKSKVGRKQVKVSQHEKGPKQFPLYRMLAIFYSMLDENEKPLPSALLLSQISTLVTLRLLSIVNNQPLMPKYKCIVSLDFIIQISKSVRFDITSHLIDFNM